MQTQTHFLITAALGHLGRQVGQLVQAQKGAHAKACNRHGWKSLWP